MSILLVLLTTFARAGEAFEIPAFTSPALEALVPAFARVAPLPALGNCPAQVKRVHAVNLAQGEVVENAVNGFVSDLGLDRDRAYEFGLIVTTPREEERVRRSVLALGETPALGELADRVWAVLASESGLSFASGTAVYSQRPDHEDELNLRVIVDHATDEFLLLAVGACR